MERNGQRYCDFCNLLVGDQKHATFKKPGTKDYLHFHNRNPHDDCWAKWMAQHTGIKLPLVNKPCRL